MLAKRLTSMLRRLAPGINSKGQPTIAVGGQEVVIDAYFRILALADSGKSRNEIVSHIIHVTESNALDAGATFGSLVDNILENERLVQASLTAPVAKHDRASIVREHQQPRKSVLSKPRRVTTHVTFSEPTLRSPTSPDKEEEKLVIEALRLMAERDAVTKAIPDTQARRRATAALDEQIRSSLRKHQAVDDLDDARIRLELARQNLK
ncbi:uncharacterized protein HMPREF1541_07505 [Cyphellophora europaea CBS 101466]|uniref:Uncharacterized protein n=1 Tax=Cyphellophora europaea (strain CBS 101466) TaxID=1220924 RepID=W2RN65_CYPE1|nr:uncharacterized protein HMPREF1541_07505 [Cyphellophora europaea CBS 101466]ETN37882.1 hypothetical protein HMPREF1541_07505 [Cyphellophora europaea CBS 101466]